MNVNTKDNLINVEENDNLSLIPSTYNKIESFDIINPSNDKYKITFSNISDKNEVKKIPSIKKINKITYPSNIFSMLFFNWVYDLIKSSKKKNKLKFRYLGEVSENYKSKEMLKEIKPKWYGKYNEIMQKNRKQKKKSFYPLLMTLIMSNIKRIIFSLIIICFTSGLDFSGVLIFEE